MLGHHGVPREWGLSGEERAADSLRTSLSESKKPAPGASQALLGGARDSDVPGTAAEYHQVDLDIPS